MKGKSLSFILYDRLPDYWPLAADHGTSDLIRSPFRSDDIKTTCTAIPVDLVCICPNGVITTRQLCI